MTFNQLSVRRGAVDVGLQWRVAWIRLDARVDCVLGAMVLEGLYALPDTLTTGTVSRPQF